MVKKILVFLIAIASQAQIKCAASAAMDISNDNGAKAQIVAKHNNKLLDMPYELLAKTLALSIGKVKDVTPIATVCKHFREILNPGIEQFIKKTVYDNPIGYHLAAASDTTRFVHHKLANAQEEITKAIKQNSSAEAIQELKNKKDKIISNLVCAACMQNKPNILQILQSQGVDVVNTDFEVDSLLFRHIADWRKLCQYNDPAENDKITKEKFAKCSAFHLAAKCGAIDVVRFLINKATRRDQNNNIIDHAQHRIYTPDGEGNTTVLSAVSSGNLELIKMLLSIHQLPMTLTYANAKLDSILQVATRLKSSDVLSYLLSLQNMIVPNGGHLCLSFNANGKTILHLATENNSLEFVKVMFSMAPPEFRLLVNHQDNLGNTPLHYAIQSDKEILVRILRFSRIHSNFIKHTLKNHEQYLC